jgi:hypothetical protein
LSNTLFRRDLWSRGSVPLSPAAQERLLGQRSFVASNPAAPALATFAIPTGEVSYPSDLAVGMWSGLSKGPTRFDRLAAETAYGFTDRSQYLSLLINEGRALICAPAEVSDGASHTVAAKINSIFIERAQDGLEPDFLMAPAIGGALHADLIDRILLGYLISREQGRDDSLRQEISAILLSKGNSIPIGNGKSTNDRALAAKALKDRLSPQAIDARVRLWLSAGIIKNSDANGQSTQLRLSGARSE